MTSRITKMRNDRIVRITKSDNVYRVYPLAIEGQKLGYYEFFSNVARGGKLADRGNIKVYESHRILKFWDSESRSKIYELPNSNYRIWEVEIDPKHVKVLIDTINQVNLKEELKKLKEKKKALVKEKEESKNNIVVNSSEINKSNDYNLSPEYHIKKNQARLKAEIEKINLEIKELKGQIK